MTSFGELLVVVLAVNAAFAGTVSAVLAGSRPENGGRWLAAFMAGVALWSAANAITWVVDDLGVDLIAERFVYVGVGLIAVGFVAFALAYTGREQYLTRRTVAGLSALPAATFLLSWGPWGLVIRGAAAAGDPPGMVLVRGPLFWLFAAYVYVLLLAGTGLLGWMFLRTREVYRLQVAVVLVGLLPPWVASAVFLTTPLEFDPTPVAFLVTGAALSWAIVRMDFMDLTPVARDRVVEEIGHGVFVLDGENRFVDVNSTGRRMLDVGDEQVIGRTVGEVLPERPELVRAYEDAGDRTDEVVVPTDDGVQFYRVEVSTLRDREGTASGRLFLVQDVTERRRRERELRRTNAQLDRFASVVSHDLKNPLNVVEGYVDTARETGDVEHLAEAKAGIDQMRQLIEDLLSLARDGREVAELAPASLGDVASDAWTAVETADATLSIDDDVAVLADRDRLQQLLENLFRNAVDHGGEDVTVRVGPVVARPAGAVAGPPDAFFVEDDGPGIAEEVREAVFDHGYTTSDEGTGLGLSIVESIATAHGWDVTVTDAADGGARFEFSGVGVADDDPTIVDRTGR